MTVENAGVIVVAVVGCVLFATILGIFFWLLLFPVVHLPKTTVLPAKAEIAWGPPQPPGTLGTPGTLTTTFSSTPSPFSSSALTRMRVLGLLN